MALKPIKDLSIFLPNRTQKPQKPCNTEVTGRLDLSTISKESSPFTKEEQADTKLDALTGPSKPKSISLFG
jgi:hypothetical protein